MAKYVPPQVRARLTQRQSMEDSLFYAAQALDLEEMKRSVSDLVTKRHHTAAASAVNIRNRCENRDTLLLCVVQSRALAYNRQYVACVAFLVAQGVDVNGTNQVGLSPLSVAAMNAYVCHNTTTLDQIEQVIERLVNAGANVNAASPDGESPLLLVARGRSFQSIWNVDRETELFPREYNLSKIYDFLLERGADPSLQRNDGYSLLMHLASAPGGVPVIEQIEMILKDTRIDVSQTDAQGRTALMRACHAGFPYVVCLLWDAGAKRLDMRDADGHSPFDYVCAGAALHNAVKDESKSERDALTERDFPACIKALHHVYWKQANIKTLVLACAGPYECENVVKLVLELFHALRKDVNEDVAGWTPLHWAAALGHRQVVECLLDAGASCHARDGQGRSVLFLAAMHRQDHVVGVLLRKSPDCVNDVDNDGNTVMHHLYRIWMDGGRQAVQTVVGPDRKVKLCSPREEDALERTLVALVQGGTDITKPNGAFQRVSKMWDQNGRNILWLAARVGCVDAMRHCVEQGVPVNPVDPDMPVPLVAVVRGTGSPRTKCQALTFLLDQGACVYQYDPHHGMVLFSAVELGDVDVIRLLLDRGVPVNATREDLTPLMMAATQGSESVVCCLLEAGASCNAQTVQGQTALMMACARGDRACVKLLAVDAESVLMQNEKGQTGYDMAMHALIRAVRFYETPVEHVVNSIEYMLIIVLEDYLDRDATLLVVQLCDVKGEATNRATLERSRTIAASRVDPDEAKRAREERKRQRDMECEDAMRRIFERAQGRGT